MPKHSFFIKHWSLTSGQVITKEMYPELFHQLTHVLRVKIGQHYYFLDGKGLRAEVEILSIGKNTLEFTILSSEQLNPPQPLHLYCPLIKLPKIEQIIQMCTQLGVTDFYFFASEHTDELPQILSPVKKERLIRIASEATEQSERFFLPEIHFHIHSLDTLPLGDYHVAVEREQLSKNENDRSKDEIRRVIIGPEGGWSKREVEFFQKLDYFYPLSLKTKNILRAETAAVVGVTSLL